MRAAERGGQVLLPDVVRLFEKYIKSPPRSGAAEALLPDPQQNAVSLMTVHSAKGLTKRICFVPDISFGDVSDPGFAMFSPQGLLEMSLPGLTGEKVKSPGWDDAREADKEVRKLELTNVFYVAMTRARDLVVLSGAGTQKPDGWLKMATGFFETASDRVLRQLTYSELPDVGNEEEIVPEISADSIDFQPLKIPAALERIPVTRLVTHLKTDSPQPTSSPNRIVLGTVGHAVLEELARNNWAGNIPKLVNLFGTHFNATDRDALVLQLEKVRDVLLRETASAVELRTEYPFVMKRGDLILDGTIDLLVQITPKQWKLFDYKFTRESAELVRETYALQLNAYQEAVEKLYPGAEVTAQLVLIGDTVQLVSV